MFLQFVIVLTMPFMSVLLQPNRIFAVDCDFHSVAKILFARSNAGVSVVQQEQL